MPGTTQTRSTAKAKVGAAIGGSALLGAALTAALFMGPGGASSDQILPTTKTDQLPLGNNKDYSLTQTVTNNSSQALTLNATWVDNGGTVTQTEDSVAANSSQVYVATNHGNGVQMSLTFTAANNDTVYVDTDIPKVWSNEAKATITGKGLSISDLDVSNGDNAKASIVLEDCSKRCTTTAEFPEDIG